MGSLSACAPLAVSRLSRAALAAEPRSASDPAFGGGPAPVPSQAARADHAPGSGGHALHLPAGVPRPLPRGLRDLLLDVMWGDATLFMRDDQVDAAWSVFTPILEAWQATRPDFQNYAAGSWAPTQPMRSSLGMGGGA